MHIHNIYINASIHPSKFKPKTSFKCTKVLTNKSFQDLIGIKKYFLFLLCLAHNYLGI